jgi:hypothetical protein
MDESAIIKTIWIVSTPNNKKAPRTSCRIAICCCCCCCAIAIITKTSSHIIFVLVRSAGLRQDIGLFVVVLPKVHPNKEYIGYYHCHMSSPNQKTATVWFIVFCDHQERHQRAIEALDCSRSDVDRSRNINACSMNQQRKESDMLWIHSWSWISLRASIPTPIVCLNIDEVSKIHTRSNVEVTLSACVSAIQHHVWFTQSKCCGILSTHIPTVHARTVEESHLGRLFLGHVGHECVWTYTTGDLCGVVNPVGTHNAIYKLPHDLAGVNDVRYSALLVFVAAILSGQ